MKRLNFLLAIVLFFGTNIITYSQGGVNLKTKSNLIHRLPSESNGFLILNAYENPDVVKWEVKFLRPEFNSSGQLTSLSPSRTVELDGTYFTDEVEVNENSNGFGYIDITGFNTSNVVIAHDGPVVYACVGCGIEDICVSSCDGKTYAYALLSHGPIYQGGSTGGGNGSVYVAGVSSSTGSPLYRYFSYSQWNTFTSQNNLTNKVRDHYGFPMTTSTGAPFPIGLEPGYLYDPAAADMVIRIPAILNTSSVSYYDMNGVSISGDVYGIRKSQGLWRHYNDTDVDFITGLATFCNGGYPLAELKVNSEINDWTWETNTPWNEAVHLQQNGLTVSGRPPLDCDGTSTDNLPSTPVGNSDLGATWEPCDWVWSHDYIVDENGEIISFPPNSNVFDWTPCSDEPNSNGNPWKNWPDLYESLTLSPADPDNTTGPIVVSHRSGTITKQTTGSPARDSDFQSGLYHAFFLFSDNSYLSRYIYVGENDVLPDLEKDHLTVVASPVPVTEENFFLDLDSDMDLNFTYKLLTTSGDVLFEKEYNLTENEDIRDIIQILNFSGPGVLINHFQFSDGSSKSFNISKL